MTSYLINGGPQGGRASGADLWIVSLVLPRLPWKSTAVATQNTAKASAASRVASERMVSQVTSSTLPERLSLQPHQRGFFFSTVRMSGS